MVVSYPRSALDSHRFVKRGERVDQTTVGQRNWYKWRADLVVGKYDCGALQ